MAAPVRVPNAVLNPAETSWFDLVARAVLVDRVDRVDPVVVRVAVGRADSAAGSVPLISSRPES